MVATQSFVAVDPNTGQEHYIREREKIRSDHPAVGLHPYWFVNATDTD